MNDIKDIINRLCDLERRMANIETQSDKESTLQEISDIGQWDTSDMAHRSGGLSVEQEHDNYLQDEEPDRADGAMWCAAAIRGRTE